MGGKEIVSLPIGVCVVLIGFCDGGDDGRVHIIVDGEVHVIQIFSFFIIQFEYSLISHVCLYLYQST